MSNYAVARTPPWDGLNERVQPFRRPPAPFGLQNAPARTRCWPERASFGDCGAVMHEQQKPAAAVVLYSTENVDNNFKQRLR